MPIYALGNSVPDIHPTAYVHPDAVLIGAVILGEGASVWPGAVIRADDATIRVGARTSIQDNSVLHTTAEHPTTVGNDCVVGHMVHLEGCIIDDHCLIGSGSIVLHRVHVHTGAVVAANSTLLNDLDVPSGAMAVGTPAVVKEGRARAGSTTYGVASYLERAVRYRDDLRRID